MTTKRFLVGASSTCETIKWEDIPNLKAQRHVYRLQIRIAKAMEEGRIGKVKALQRILTNSFYSKFLAVKHVTSTTGKFTPGVDDKIWSTNLQKTGAINLLKRRGYKPLPLKRVYIPKKQGNNGKRPLSIPAMKDRAMQALWLLALYPIAEKVADPNSYGFRTNRSAKDAIEQCFVILGRKKSARYVLEGDIKSCFDNISHEWLLKNIPMDKIILRKFLKTKIVKNGGTYPVVSGIPQGGVISPCLTLITLSGLEKKLKSRNDRIRNKEKINLVAYADHCIITGASEEVLNKKVIPIVEEFLRERGLELSKEKTKIRHIEEGFDFLGFNIRKYGNGKFLTKPSKGSIKNFLQEIKEVIKSNIPLPTNKLILLLNPKIMGWCNYYSSVVSSKIFSYVDYRTYKYLDYWINRRHSNKGKRWMTKKYFTKYRLSNWRFFATIKDKEGNNKPIYLRKASDTKIKRHIKIRGEANPFDLKFKEYFEKFRKKELTPESTSFLGASMVPYRCPSEMR